MNVDLTPTELAKLRALVATPAESTRIEMSATERRALGKQLAEQYDQTITRGGAAAAALRAKLEAAIDEARGKLERLDEERADAVSGYATWRDGITRRLWTERPEIADFVVAELEAEARSLVPTSRTSVAPADPRLGLFHPRPPAGKLMAPIGSRPDAEDVPVQTFSNGPHVLARQRALLALAELVKEWTAKGAYADAAELRRLVEAERAKLPHVPTIEELAR